MTGFILCAGFGERLRPLTLKLAKPAVPFLNIPLMGYPLHHLEELGVSKLLINTHYLPETVEAAAHKLSKGQPYTVQFLAEQPEILGSGGAIWNARSELKGRGDFVVINGDTVSFFPQKNALKKLLDQHRQSQALATLLVCPLEGVGERIPGVWVDSQNQIRNFGKSASSSGLHCRHFTGIAAYSEKLLSYLPEGPSNILYDVLQTLIAKGSERIQVLENSEMIWLETGTLQDYVSASRDCLHRLKQPWAAKYHLTDILNRFNPGWSLEAMEASVAKLQLSQ